MKKQRKRLMNLQNIKNHREPPRGLVQSIIDTFTKGQKKEAIIQLDALIKDYPLVPLLFNVSGSFYKSNNQLDVAVTKFNQALALKPNYTEVHYNLGVTLRELGLVEEAIKSYKNALNIKNEYPNAHYNLGNALLSIKKYDAAIKHFESAVVFNPEFAQAYYNLGLAYKLIKNDFEAGLSFDKALAIKPDYAEAANDRGVIFKNSGDLENALKYFQKSLAINPNLADAYNNIGITEKQLNKIDNAIKSFESAISVDPNFADAYYNLSLFKQYTLSKNQVAKMQSILISDGISQSDLISINFALAKASESLDNQDEFLSYLHKGNRLRKKELNYSIDMSHKFFSTIYDAFALLTNSNVKSLQNITPTKRPIFILGMPRSGTSLVEQIISSHEEVYGAGEINSLLEPILEKILSNEKNKNIFSDKNLLSMRKKYLDSFAQLSTSANVITDKTPANFQYIGFILSMFPDAKIIHLKRDPRAICWSIYQSNWYENGYRFSYNMDDLATYYGLYSKLMDFWHKKFPEKIYDICYEDLTTSQEDETKKLLEYCELDWDDNCLNFHKNKRSVKTASSQQVREKMYQGSSEAWKKYESHIQPLIDGLKPYLKK
jgi:tetratricopeptide (TPR) repeat protein